MSLSQEMAYVRCTDSKSMVWTPCILPFIQFHRRAMLASVSWPMRIALAVSEFRSMSLSSSIILLKRCSPSLNSLEAGRNSQRLCLSFSTLPLYMKSWYVMIRFGAVISIVAGACKERAFLTMAISCIAVIKISSLSSLPSSSSQKNHARLRAMLASLVPLRLYLPASRQGGNATLVGAQGLVPLLSDANPETQNCPELVSSHPCNTPCTPLVHHTFAHSQNACHSRRATTSCLYHFDVRTRYLHPTPALLPLSC